MKLLTHIGLLVWSMAALAVVPLALGQAEPTVASSEEARARLAFDVAKRFFRNENYTSAIERLEAFLLQYPNSALKPEAVLLENQARFQMGQFEGVVNELQSELSAAGTWSDRYLFWIGEAQFALGQFAKAAEVYGLLIENYPESDRALEAALGQAQAHYQLDELKELIATLEPADGPFQKSANATPTAGLIIDGRLLLANAYFELEELGAARLLLENLSDEGLSPERFWQKYHLLASVYLAETSLDRALSGATNLVQLAKGIADPVFTARSADFHGDVLREMEKLNEAILVYEQNLTTNVPVGWRRSALLKIADVYVQENRLSNAVQRLERFFIQHPNDPATSLSHMTLGELRLRQFYALPEAGRPRSTNLLSEAVGHFDVVLKTKSDENLMGKSWAGRGWALWEWGTLSGRAFQINMAKDAFTNAVHELPRSREQAVAQFKVADCMFQGSEHASAISNYWAAINIATNTVGWDDRLVDRALYQIVRSGVQRLDLPSAGQAVSNLLEWFPNSFFSDRSMLLYGQSLNRQGKPSEAREVLTSFAKAFPQSQLLPETRLAVARTHVMDGSWVSSILEYDRWVTNYPSHTALSQAEFDRAWLNHQAGNSAKAFQLFTNYIERFPTNQLAPLAQKWIADFHFQSGKFADAEQVYRRLFENTNLLELAGSLAWEARLSAGRSAFFRQNHADAETLLSAVVNATNAPVEEVARAEFYLGDVAAEQTARTPTNLVEAITHYQRVAREMTNSPLNAAAWGRLGDCHLQLGELGQALAAYQTVTELSGADVTTRSQAQLGLARVLVEQADTTGETDQADNLLQQSLDHCLGLVFGGNLRSANEKMDPYWVKEAGLMAGRLAKRLGQAEQERKLYTRLAKELPTMPLWQAKLDLINRKTNAPAPPKPLQLTAP